VFSQTTDSAACSRGFADRLSRAGLVSQRHNRCWLAIFLDGLITEFPCGFHRLLIGFGYARMHVGGRARIAKRFCPKYCVSRENLVEFFNVGSAPQPSEGYVGNMS